LEGEILFIIKAKIALIIDKKIKILKMLLVSLTD